MSDPVSARVPGGNLLAELSTADGSEAFESLFEDTGLRIERIVSMDHASPDGFWYDQPQDEWVMVAAGEAIIEFDDGSRRSLRPGDWLMLHARVRHRIAATFGRTVWLAVHRDREQR